MHSNGFMTEERGKEWRLGVGTYRLGIAVNFVLSGAEEANFI